ncbi:alpha/beta fold hydrolase [Actinoallomurus acanthiterrae]
MPSTTTSRWIVPLNISRDPAVRLLCLPHCGGGPTAFRALAAQAPEEIDVCAALLPARESRRQEPPEREMARLVDALADAVAERPGAPYALLGYCFGAYTAFELAMELAGRGMPPVHLFPVAASSPATIDRARNVYQLPSEYFLKFMRDQGVIPEIILGDPKIFQVFEPTIRADLELFEKSPYRPARDLAVPITVLGARRDLELSELLDWQRETVSSFGMRVYDGDHSFFVKDIAVIADHLASDLLDRQGRLR